MVKEINDTNFEQEVLKDNGTVVVDFWASWCGPCKMLAPVMEEVEKELGSKVKFVKVNVDENPVASNKYKVSSIPTLITFKEGQAVDMMVGFRPKDSIVENIKKNM